MQTFDGWHLIGAFPDNAIDDVGSWLLTNNGEAALLEVPPGLTPRHVRSALAGAKLRYVMASHSHEDHLDTGAWKNLKRCFLSSRFIHPSTTGDQHLTLSGEPLYLIKAPKHSIDDVVTVFRGVAMTGDIELGTVTSVNSEVPRATKIRSMNWLRDFQKRVGYHIHSTVSAHLNDIRSPVQWNKLF